MTLVVIPTLTKEGARRAEALASIALTIDMVPLIIDNGGYVVKTVSRRWLAGPAPSVAASWNLALRHWERNTIECGHVVLILNDDIEIDRGGMEELSLHADLSHTRYMNGRGPLELIGAEPHPFSCFAMHRSLLDAVGYFDEQFAPAYYEDTDYLVRMERAGVALRAVDVGVKHTPATTAKELGTTWTKIAAESKKKFEAKWGKRRPYFKWPYNKKPEGVP